jgi:hypothetical protein
VAEAFRTEALLGALVAATAPTADLDDAFMCFPDYSVAALVGGLELSRRLGQPVSYRVVRPGPIARGLHWPRSLGSAVQCTGLQLGAAPTRPADEQVVRVASEEELDRLTAVLIGAHGHDSVTEACLFWTLQDAGRNALRWSLDRTAYVGWATRGARLDIAVGDSGPGIPNVSGAATATRLALEDLVAKFDDLGRPANGLTRMREHWLNEVPHITAYVASGDELHTFQRYNSSFRRIAGAGPTVVAARF